jgi:hypothetical protein
MNKGNEYYVLAASKLKEVVDGVESGTYKYALFDEYWKVYSQTYNYSNTELILGIYFSRDRGPTTASICDLPSDYYLATQGWGDACGEIKFWKDFPEGPRKEATYLPKLLTSGGELIDWWEEMFDGKFIDGWKEMLDENGKIKRLYFSPFFQKTAETSERNTEWDYKNHSAATNTGEKTRQLLRLSQVYCWYAEAVGRSGQTNALAVEVLNRVRNRADGEATNRYPAGMSATDLAEAAYNEHGWEIGGYYWCALAARFHDMRRMYRVREHFEFRKQNPPIEVAPGVFRSEQVLVESYYRPNNWHDGRMYLAYPGVDARINAQMQAENEKRYIR